MESSSPSESKRRRGGKLSTDPQSVAARRRRHRISERFKTLQSLVPGAANMDTASLLEEAIHYVHFLKAQIWLHHNACFLASSSAGVDTEPDGDDGVVFTPPPPPLPPPWDPPCNAFRHPSAEEWAPAVEPPPLPGYSGGFRGGNVAAFDDLYYIDP